MSIQLVFRGTPGGSPRHGSGIIRSRQAASDGSVRIPGDGWTWPIQVLETGWVNGSIEGGTSLPQYFPLETAAQVAAECSSARFGRRHPATASEETDPTRVAGIITNGHMEGNRVLGTLQLYSTETQIRAQLIGAAKAGMLDLFGLSINAIFEMAEDVVEGMRAVVIQKLVRLISVDFVLDAGAGGKILPSPGYRAAASDYLPPELATIRQCQNTIAQITADSLYLAAIQCTLATAEAIQSECREAALGAARIGAVL